MRSDDFVAGSTNHTWLILCGAFVTFMVISGMVVCLGTLYGFTEDHEGDLFAGSTKSFGHESPTIADYSVLARSGDFVADSANHTLLILCGALVTFMVEYVMVVCLGTLFRFMGDHEGDDFAGSTQHSGHESLTIADYGVFARSDDSGPHSTPLIWFCWDGFNLDGDVTY